MGDWEEGVKNQKEKTWGGELALWWGGGGGGGFGGGCWFVGVGGVGCCVGVGFFGGGWGEIGTIPSKGKCRRRNDKGGGGFLSVKGWRGFFH